MKNFKRKTAIAIVTISMIGLATGNAMAVEEAKYSVITHDNNFELREYAPHIVAEVMVDGAFEEAGSTAFRPLFQYISGDNKAQQKVAMTSPVGQSQQDKSQKDNSQKIAMTSPVGQSKQDGKWAISFMMPASFTLETTPQPTNSQVNIRQVPARPVASIQYSGSWGVEKYETQLAKLTAWIDKQNYTAVGEPELARYNSPYALPFLRRNEILIPVTVD